MIAVIFEVTPADGDAYLQIAADLAPRLAAVDGFISVERFQSLADRGKLVSLSFWRDAAAVAAWRGTTEHRAAQAAGRAGVLSGYRLRVAEVIRDYGLEARGQAPADSRDIHG